MGMVAGKKSAITSAEKTRTSVVLGNDYFPKRTTYQSAFNDSKGKPYVEKATGHELAEVLPHQVYPPPREPLKRTIYQEDFACKDYKNTLYVYKEQHERMKSVSRIHKLIGVPLAPHSDMTSETEPSQQQTAYCNRTNISKGWPSIQVSAENGLDPATKCNNRDKAEAYEKLPTEHQRQFRWPVPDDIHVVTYQQTK